jgi:hypothetical protein
VAADSNGFFGAAGFVGFADGFADLVIIGLSHPPYGLALLP